MKNISKLKFYPIGRGEGEGETFTQEQLAEAVSSALSKEREANTTANEGLSNKNSELLQSVKDLKAQGKKYEGVDLDGLLALQKTVQNDEVLRLMSEGKHEDALELSTEKMRVTHTAELDALKTQLETATESGQKDKALVAKLLIDGGAQSAFVAAKGLDTALSDISLRARQVWTIEEGELVARDSSGTLMQGEKGPITMTEWAESLKETAPHLFPASESGSLKGGKNQNIDMSSIDAQIVAAAKSHDFPRMKHLKQMKKEGKAS